MVSVSLISEDKQYGAHTRYAGSKTPSQTTVLIYVLCRTSAPDVRGSQGHGTWVWRRKGEVNQGRRPGPGVLCYHQTNCHNSSTVASRGGCVMGFHRAVNHFPGGGVLLPVLKRLRFPSRRSNGKLGEGGGGQVLETFSGGIPNRIPLKSDPGREVDAVQLTSGPRLRWCQNKQLH